ncbi:MAG TPA: cyclic nucleotide-binding domain-containing protein [Kiloniellaceae bacterium]|nr:cyclic nucleotide-binding domain-containing protein [Kiloniellaceae bacterium]
MSAAPEATAGEERLFKPGQVIFREGERGGCAYLVRSGTVEIFKSDGDDEVFLARCTAGELFGEMALIDDVPRSDTARATTHTACLVLSKERFRRLLEEADPFIRGLLRILSGNVRVSNHSIALFHKALTELGAVTGETAELRSDGRA